jgi:hypothetical protein
MDHTGLWMMAEGVDALGEERSTRISGYDKVLHV